MWRGDDARARSAAAHARRRSRSAASRKRAFDAGVEFAHRPHPRRAGEELMARAPALGRFITLEGGEGAGKSVQARRLAARLGEAGLDGRADPRAGRLAAAPRRCARSFCRAARRATARSARRCCSAPPGSTISTRRSRRRWSAANGWSATASLNSTRAYQGAAGRLDPALVASLERVAVGDCRPDLTLVLDLPAAEGLARAAARRGAGGRRPLRRARGWPSTKRSGAPFWRSSQREPERCALIDARPGEGEVAAAIWAAVRARLGEALNAATSGEAMSRPSERRAAGKRRLPGRAASALRRAAGRPRRRRSGDARRLSRGTARPRLADRRPRRESARRRSPGASRASCSPIPIRRRRRRGARAISPSPADHPAARQLAALSHPDFALAAARMERQVEELLLGNPRRGRARRLVDVPHVGGLRRLAGRDRRLRRRPQPRRRQRAAEDDRGAAAARADPDRRAPAGAGAADHPLALPPAAARTADARARSKRRSRASARRGARSIRRGDAQAAARADGSVREALRRLDPDAQDARRADRRGDRAVAARRPAHGSPARRGGRRPRRRRFLRRAERALCANGWRRARAPPPRRPRGGRDASFGIGCARRRARPRRSISTGELHVLAAFEEIAAQARRL